MSIFSNKRFERAIARGVSVYDSDAKDKVLALANQTVNEDGAATYSIYHNQKLDYALQTVDAEDDLIEAQMEKA